MHDWCIMNKNLFHICSASFFNISYEAGSHLWNRKLCYSAFFFLGSGIVI